MTIDISFTEKTSQVVEVPLTIQGKCTGPQVLMQKVIILMITHAEEHLRYEGAGLYGNLRNANVSEDGLERIENIINIAIAEVVETIKADQDSLDDLPADERLTSIAATAISVPQQGSLSVELTIISESGDELAAALNLEI